MPVLGASTRWGAPALLGIALGAASAWWITGERGVGEIPGHTGWRGDPTIGAIAAGPYARARIARIGLLALNRNEAMYYIADSDASGLPLRASCTYAVDGAAMPARWWSLTLYAQDRFLARNNDRAHAVGAANLVVARDGAWSIRVAPGRDDAGNWLSTRAAGDFTLGLRLYRPDQAIVDGRSIPDLPTVRRIACGEGQR